MNPTPPEGPPPNCPNASRVVLCGECATIFPDMNPGDVIEIHQHEDSKKPFPEMFRFKNSDGGESVMLTSVWARIENTNQVAWTVQCLERGEAPAPKPVEAVHLCKEAGYISHPQCPACRQEKASTQPPAGQGERKAFEAFFHNWAGVFNNKSQARVIYDEARQPLETALAEKTAEVERLRETEATLGKWINLQGGSKVKLFDEFERMRTEISEMRSTIDINREENAELILQRNEAIQRDTAHREMAALQLANQQDELTTLREDNSRLREWTRIFDEMPEDWKTVSIYSRVTDEVFAGYWNPDEGRWVAHYTSDADSESAPTCWKPLPPAPVDAETEGVG